jgi:hypothetical protein
MEGGVLLDAQQVDVRGGCVDGSGESQVRVVVLVVR